MKILLVCSKSSVVVGFRKKLIEKHAIANSRIKAVSVNGEDLIRYDIVVKRK